MPEMRADMLPDAEATVNVTKEALPEKVEPKVIQGEMTDEETVTPPVSETPKGMVPFQALDEERRKRKDLEKKLKEIESSSSLIPDDQLSDEGRVLKQEIQKQAQKIESLEAEKQRDQIYAKYPQVADKAGEFEDFREEYASSGLSLDKIAKLFIVEKGLTEAPKRKGLERPTSGPKTVRDQEFSDDDVSRLMKSDEKKFIKMIREGKFDKMGFKQS